MPHRQCIHTTKLYALPQSPITSHTSDVHQHCSKTQTLFWEHLPLFSTFTA